MRRGIQKSQNKFKYAFELFSTSSFVYQGIDMYTAFLKFQRDIKDRYYEYKVYWNGDNKTYTITRHGINYTKNITEIPIDLESINWYSDIPF